MDRKLDSPRPQGIKSSVPQLVDTILKESLEKYRGDLPPGLSIYPELKGFQLYSGEDLKKMRHWASNPLSMLDEKGNKIHGAFDDLLHNPDTDTYAYLDYKTTGKPPAPDFGAKYYQSQCDIYTNFLVRGGKKVADFGALLFFWPMPGQNGQVEFHSKVQFLTPNIAAADKLFKDAMELLDKDEVPASGPMCEYCSFIKKRSVHESR